MESPQLVDGRKRVSPEREDLIPLSQRDVYTVKPRSPERAAESGVNNMAATTSVDMDATPSCSHHSSSKEIEYDFNHTGTDSC